MNKKNAYKKAHECAGEQKLKARPFKKLWGLALGALLGLGAANVYGQAPTLSYATPQTYQQGIAIAPLAPTSSGVGRVGYSTDVLFAGLSLPYGVAVDHAGNIYVTDFGHNQVKKFPAGGGAPVILASGINTPYGIAVDGSRNVYVSGNNNTQVFKIPVGGGAPVTIASGFKYAEGLAVDAAGNVYVADYWGGKVKKIPVGGGAPVAVGSGFDNPSDVAIDAAGNIYVADGNIRKISVINGSTTIIQTVAYTVTSLAIGNGGDIFVSEEGEPAARMLKLHAGKIVATYPLDDSFGATAIAVDVSGNIYPAEPFDGFIRKIPAAGGAGSLLGQAFSAPKNIVRDAAGNLYVLAAGTGTIEKYPADGSPLVTIASGISSNFGIAIDNAANLYYYDSDSGEIKKMPAGGGATVTVGTLESNPTGFTADAAGNVYIANSASVSKIPAGGGKAVVVATGQSNLSSIAVDLAGNIYAIESIPYAQAPNYYYSLVKIPVGGGPQTVLANDITFGPGISCDAAGNVYVFDDSGNIREVMGGSGTAVVIASGLVSPTGVTADNSGNIYICEPYNNMIKKIRLTGGYYTNPSLPPGLTINNATGVISGAAISTSTATNYQVTAYNSSGSISAPLSISVNAPPPPTISYGGPYMYAKSKPITPLTPVSTNVAVYGYNNAIKALPGSTNAGVIADAAGNVYLDFGTSVKKIPADGGPPVVIVSGLTQSSGLAVDNAGNVYVSDYVAKTVTKFPAGGGAGVVIASGLRQPGSLAVSNTGDVYVYDKSAVVKIPVGGGPRTNIASGNIAGFAVDATGNLFIAYPGQSSIKEITVGGASVTIASKVQADGIAVDALGNVLFTNSLTQNGVFMVPAGGGSVVTLFSGQGIVANVVIDGKGNIYTNGNYNAQAGTFDVVEMSPSGGYFLNKSLPAGLSFSTSTGVISGTPTGVSASANYNITAVNSAGNATATVNIGVENVSINLAKLTLSTGTLSPAFNADSANYKVTEGAVVGTLYITPTAVDTTSTIKVNGASVKSGKQAAVTLATGVNTVNIVVTTKDNSASRTYTIVVGKGSSNDQLAGISLSNGSLSPVFATGTTSYTATVSKITASITITPRTTTGTATIKVNGTAVTSGTASAPITLNAGDNTIAVAVTAQNGLTTQTYTITVTRPTPPTITPGTATGSISACAGDASASPNIQQFAVSGIALNGNIIATAPTNFQVSLSAGSGFAHAVSLVQTGGVVSNQIVYVRSAATAPAGSISGNVVLTSPSAATQSVAVSGTVNALLAVNPVANQTVVSGAKTAAINFTGTAGVYTWVNSTPGIGLPANGSGNIASFSALNTGTSPLTATVTVTPGAFPPRAYIANTVSNTVSVIDINTQSVMTTIPVGQEPYGVSVSPDSHRVYVANRFSKSISVINTVTNTVIFTIPETAEPDLIVVSPDGHRLYVVSQSNDIVQAFDAGTGAVIATTSLGGFPGGVAISPDGGKVYVTSIGSNTVSVINTATNTVVSTIAVGTNPEVVAVSPDGSRVYVTNFTSSNVSVINTSTNTVIATIPVGNTPWAVTVSPDGTKVYVADQTSRSVSVINAATNTVLTTITGLGSPFASSITPDGSLLYVANQTGTVTVINTLTNSIVATIPVGNLPDGIGNFISGSTGCPGVPTKFTITVDPIVNTLSNLTLSAGSLSPLFSKDITGYQVTEPAGTSSITLTPTATDSKATITVNGTAVISGRPSTSIPLSAGLNTINVVVTAEDGTTTKTYTITVGKGSSNDNLSGLGLSHGTLSPVFATATHSYTATVTNTTSSITVTPQAAQVASTITVNGNPVASGAPSGAIALSVGPNTINITVTAQDGITQQTYTVTVTRPASTNANLASLKFTPGVLTPAFTTANTSYAIHVVNGVGAVTVTPTAADATAEVTVNGTAQASGTATNPIHINVGINTFTIQVTAQDLTTTKTYTVVVTRAASNNDNLANLSLSAGTLSPAFATATTGYTASVVNGVDSIRVMPTAVDAGAVITVNGVATTSGQQSPRFVVNVGDNTFHVTVTAEDGVTSQTYTVTITKQREFSHDAYLSYLQLNRNVDIPISPAFGYLTNNYTATVSNSTDSIKVTEVTADGGATATINGIPSTQRTPTQPPIALNVGPNTITIMVTAEDGTTTDTYTVVVTRMAAGEQSLSEMAEDGITVHQGLSPNGDGVNDVLAIDGITQYPDNKLTIINANGNQIFEAKGYDNATKVFDGHDSHTGKMQLPGTYYFSLEYTVKGVTKHRTGYIVMKY